MDIKISEAKIDDLPIILALQKKCYVSEAELYNDFTIQPLQQDLESITQEFENGIILKAILDNQIIGSIRAYSEKNTCFIGKLIVHPEFQNKGIGKLLMKLIEIKFATCNKFELFTGAKSEKNLYIYKKQGYKEFKQIKINESVRLIYLQKSGNTFNLN